MRLIAAHCGSPEAVQLAAQPSVLTARVQAALDGVRRYEADAAPAEGYDSRPLSDSGCFDDERRGLLRDIRWRGGIHG